jgi:hypothetical protein
LISVQSITNIRTKTMTIGWISAVVGVRMDAETFESLIMDPMRLEKRDPMTFLNKRQRKRKRQHNCDTGGTMCDECVTRADALCDARYQFRQHHIQRTNGMDLLAKCDALEDSDVCDMYGSRFKLSVWQLTHDCDKDEGYVIGLFVAVAMGARTKHNIDMDHLNKTREALQNMLHRDLDLTMICTQSSPLNRDLCSIVACYVSCWIPHMFSVFQRTIVSSSEQLIFVQNDCSCCS